MSLFANVPRWIREVPGHLKTKEMCDKAVPMEPYSLKFLPDRLKTEDTCIEAVRRKAYPLEYIPDNLKTQKMWNELMWKTRTVFFLVPDQFKTYDMCIEALEVDPWQLHDVPDYFKTKEMCDQAVKHDSYSLRFLPDWFVTQEQIEIWHNDTYYYNDDELIEWYDAYKKRKAQKAKIKELLPIAWHPYRVMDWYMSEDEKRWWKQQIVVFCQKKNDMLSLKMY